MRRRWLARTGVGVLVIAALAAGRAVTDAMPLTPDGARMAAAPFVRDGEVGNPLDLRWAEIEVTRVREAAAVDYLTLVGSPGVFVVVDLRVVAKQEPRHLGGLHLVDREGRRYDRDTRTGFTFTQAPTGIDWYITVAFDVPPEALPGLELEVAIGEDPWWDNRRDEIGHVDLGLGEDDVERFTGTRDIISDFQAGPTPPETEPLGELDE
ncbi:MAG: hypothetical protein WBQ50_11820 [Nocardioides sp.]